MNSQKDIFKLKFSDSEELIFSTPDGKRIDLRWVDTKKGETLCLFEGIEEKINEVMLKEGLTFKQ